ncbi:MAG: FapA family protein [Treponemataceae bacterium]|nr:MAG: FapA family protein [Treponemataceae bacterium]
MVTLEEIRSRLRERFQYDSELRYVDVRADTIEEALSDAAVQLASVVAHLEYEVLERGSNGFLGFSKNPWFLRVYESAELKQKFAGKGIFKDGEDDSLAEDGDVAGGVATITNGVFYVHCFASDVMLKVVPPRGGRAVKIDDVMARLRELKTEGVDAGQVKKLVAKGTDGIYEMVGVYEHSPECDAKFTLAISSDEMEARIVAEAPKPGGSDISQSSIEELLSSIGVVDGYDDSHLVKFVDKPKYGESTIIAYGQPAINGRDARVECFFETDKSKLQPKQASDGSVNFKELNIIQNVVAGQCVAKILHAESGIPGSTLCGKMLAAKDGKEVKLALGKNVSIAEDGESVHADINGQVLLESGKVTVEPVMTIGGNVGVKTGNISFLGTVVVKGNVDDGFDIKSSGTIEIAGTVGACNLEAEEDIVVALGVMGRDKGNIKCGRSLIAKFVQNATVTAEDSVIVSDGIVNSNILATNKIVVQGKRAAIIGGRLIAKNYISTKTVGNSGGGSDTVLEVGYDPKAKMRLDEITARQLVLVKEVEELDLNLQTLTSQKENRESLPADKQETYNKLTARKAEVMAESDQISEEINQITEVFKQLQSTGKISVSGMVNPGSRIFVQDAHEDVIEPCNSVTFFYKQGLVYRGPYEQIPSDPPPAEKSATMESEKA